MELGHWTTEWTEDTKVEEHWNWNELGMLLWTSRTHSLGGGTSNGFVPGNGSRTWPFSSYSSSAKRYSQNWVATVASIQECSAFAPATPFEENINWTPLSNHLHQYIEACSSIKVGRTGQYAGMQTSLQSSILLQRVVYKEIIYAEVAIPVVPVPMKEHSCSCVHILYTHK